MGPRDGYRIKRETWMGFSRIFDNVWGGRRHAMVGPTQIDRFGQANISWLGDDYARPKTQLLGARGFPGNSINHANSFFVSGHSKRTFVAGEVDMVCSVGYNPAREIPGMRAFIDLRSIVTDLCVMDFGGPAHAVRVRSLHPGVSLDEVQEATGFALLAHPEIGVTPPPDANDLRILRALDPHDLRASVVRNNPAPRRA